MVERAMVTGGAGFIGANLVDRLIDDGAEVLVVDNLHSGKLERLSDARASGHVQVHQLDIRDPGLEDVVARFGPEVIFHLAAQIDVRASVDDPASDAAINVAGTVNVLAAAVGAGVDRFVFASSGGAIFGEASKVPTTERSPRAPLAPYGVSKLVVDEYLKYFRRAHGLNYAALGFSNVYGPRQDPAGEAGVVAIFTRMLLDGKRPTVFGDGTQQRDYVFVEDVTDACVRAAAFNGGAYLNIGTGVGTSVNQLLEMLRVLTGKSVDPKFAPARPGEVHRSILAAGAASRKLGWRPWTSLEEGLSRTVDWFRSEV